ncbi:MAG: hypothetical protein ACI4E1_09200 [Lachnospira sp.]
MGDKENVNKKDRLYLKLLIYMVCAVMIVAYLMILYLSIKPKVPVEYRMYYITHELKSWPGYGKLSYRSGTTEYCTENKDDNNQLFEHNVCRRYGDGWKLYGRNKNGVHMEKDTAKLYYLSDGIDGNVCVKFQINDYTGNDEVYVYINDVCIGSFNKSGLYTFSGKEVSIKDGELFSVGFEKNNSGVDFGLWSISVNAE